MKKNASPGKALCVGVNDYPGTGSDLSSCVNDAKDWKEVLEQRKYTVTTLLDSQATRKNIMAEIRKHLPSSTHPQTPGLFGSLSAKKGPMFCAAVPSALGTETPAHSLGWILRRIFSGRPTNLRTDSICNRLTYEPVLQSHER